MSETTHKPSTSSRAKRVRRVVVTLIVLDLLLVPPIVGVWYLVGMPGESFEGELPPLTAEEKSASERMEQTVKVLAADIGPRDVTHPGNLADAEKYLVSELERLGHDITRQPVVADGVTSHNLEVIIEGERASSEVVVIGAHYDTVPDTPGADDNASGTAIALDMLHRTGPKRHPRTVRFVFFTNEEPPWFKQEEMGSLVYARSCRSSDDDIVAMLSLETMGFYRDEAGSQAYPAPFSLLYPDKGNFIAFVGDLDSRDLLHATIATFRQEASFPSDGLAGPHAIPGVTFSDQWSFWVNGYPGLMVTDTAFNRNDNYHEPTDTIDTLDYDKMARVSTGLMRVLEMLADPARWPG